MPRLPGKVWVSRSEPGASRLADALMVAGHEVWCRPVLEIRALDPPQVFSIDASGSAGVIGWPRSTAPDGVMPGLILVLSSHALAGYRALLRANPQLRKVRHIGIGEQTARALDQLGIPARWPEEPSSEGLLRLLQADLAGIDEIWILAGEGGRGVLENALSSGGCAVVKFALYRRVDVEVDDLDASGVGAIVASSGEGLQAVARFWLRAGGALDVPLIVPSERTSKMALEIGFNNVHNARSAAPPDVIAELDRLAVERLGRHDSQGRE